MYFRFFGNDSPVLDPSLELDLASGEAQCILYMVMLGGGSMASLEMRFHKDIVVKATKLLGKHFRVEHDGRIWTLQGIDSDIYALQECETKKDILNFFMSHTSFSEKFYFWKTSDVRAIYNGFLGKAYLAADTVERRYLVSHYGEDVLYIAYYVLSGLCYETNAVGESVSLEDLDLLKELSVCAREAVSFYTIDISGKDSKLKKRRKKLLKLLRFYSYNFNTAFAEVSKYTFRVATADDLIEQVKAKGKYYVVREY